MAGCGKSALILRTIPLISLLTLLSATGHATIVWRYDGVEGNYLPSYRSLVTMECVGCQNVTWSSNTCQINPPTYTDMGTLESGSVKLSCFRPGLHQVTIQDSSQNTSQTFNLPLEANSYCYVWRTDTQIISSISSKPQALISVWVGERKSSNNQKREILTHQFYSLGEWPDLVSLTPSVKLNVSDSSFDRGNSWWQITVELGGVPSEVAVQITSKGIIAFDCGISPLRFLIITRSFNNSLLVLSEEKHIQSITGRKMIQVSTAEGTILLLYGKNSYISDNDLKTVQKFQVEGVSGVISGAGLTYSSLNVLVAGELYVLLHDSSEIISLSDLQLSVNSQLTGRTVQVAGKTRDIVVIWSSTNDTVLVSEDGGRSFTSTELPKPLGSVHSVAIHPFHRRLAALCASSKYARFGIYDLSTGSWNTDTHNFTFHGGNLTAEFGADDFGDVFAWEEGGIYYSPNEGVTVDALQLYKSSEGAANSSGDLVLFQWLDSEHIKQIVSGKGGRFAVLSSANRLFYGTVAVGRAVEITSGELASTEALLVFNSIDQLRIISFDSSDVVVRTIPTYPLLLDSLYPPPACPFMQWTHSPPESVHYLDKRDNLTLWASLIPAPWRSNQISLALSDPQSVEYTSHSVEEQTAVAGVVQRNMTTIIKPSGELNSTRTAVRHLATIQNLACQEPAQLVSLITMECPPDRHIRVKDIPDSCWSSYQEYTYSIPKDRYYTRFTEGKPKSDKTVEYNFELFGCPIVLPHTRNFRPTLQLYDGDVFIEEVEVDFVVWEYYGRHDFGYTASAGKVGCLRTPQTWSEMLQNSTDPNTAWTFESYRSCFEGEGKLDRETEYQILNSSGGSLLTWPEHNSIFAFGVTVVARDYSFCRLSTYFAVRVFGATRGNVLGYFLLLITCVIGVGSLVASYFVYNQVQTHR